LDEGKEAVSRLVVPGGDAAGILELVEEALDTVAQGIEQWIDRALNLAIALCRNDRIGSVEPGIFANGIAVIASVGEQRLRPNVALHQCFVGRRIVRFARCDDEAERETFAVRAGMDFTREAAARAAKTLILSPPFAPAA